MTLLSDNVKQKSKYRSRRCYANTEEARRADQECMTNRIVRAEADKRIRQRAENFDKQATTIKLDTSLWATGMRLRP
jgi:hypothetical protein